MATVLLAQPTVLLMIWMHSCTVMEQVCLIPNKRSVVACVLCTFIKSSEYWVYYCGLGVFK